MNKNPNIMNVKKRRLIETGEALIIQYGIRRITVEEICRKAGVSKMTFYKHFKNKMELARYIWVKLVEEGFELLENINHMDIPFKEKIEKMLKWEKDLSLKLSIESIEDFFHVDEVMDKMMASLFQFITESQKKGDIRPDIRPEFIVAVLDKIRELTEDEKLMRLYPHYSDYIMEIENFLWFGLINREETEEDDK